MSDNVCHTDAYGRAVDAQVVAVEPATREPVAGETIFN